MCSKSCNMSPCLIFVNFGTPTLYLGLQKSTKKYVNSQKNIAKIGQAGCSSSIIQAALKSVKSEHSTGERQWNVSKAHAPYPSKSSSAISSPQNPPQSKQGGGSCLWRFDLIHLSPPLCTPLIPPQPPWFKYTGPCLGDWKNRCKFYCSEVGQAVGDIFEQHFV